MVANDVSATTGVILAAGRGSRLQNLTDDKPKGLVEVAGRALVEWQLDAMKSAKLDSLAIVTGYRRQDYAPFQISTINNHRWAETNMVASMLCALDALAGTIIFSYSDILYDASVVKKLLNTKEDFSVVYDTDWLEIWSRRFNDPLSDAESFKIGEDQRILEIGQLASNVNEIQGQFMGLFKVSSRAAGWIRELITKQADAVDTLDTTGLLNLLISRGYPVFGVPTAGNWMEIDDQRDLRIAESMMKSGALTLDKKQASTS